MKTDLIGKVNAGYKVIKQGEKAVLAHSPTSPTPYVAWSYHITETGVPSYYWGRYSTQEFAEQAFEKKERGEYSGD